MRAEGWVPEIRYLPLGEAHPPRPTETYDLSKVVGEEIGRVVARYVVYMAVRPGLTHCRRRFDGGFSPARSTSSGLLYDVLPTEVARGSSKTLSVTTTVSE